MYGLMVTNEIPFAISRSRRSYKRQCFRKHLEIYQEFIRQNLGQIRSCVATISLVLNAATEKHMNPSVSPRQYKVPFTEPREESPLNGKIKLLRRVAASLSQAVDELEDFRTAPLTDQFDFYDEVRRFEISLIRKALRTTSGCQLKASKLLSLKPTTLNSKIKSYGILVER
jgi:transcriptional regulator with GAF, ATPase, and Fis domain